jgi:hypothetical protein
MSECPFARLMRHLTQRINMDAATASVVAQKLMKMSPEASTAILTVLEASQSNLEALAGVLVKIGFVDAVSKAGSPLDCLTLRSLTGRSHDKREEGDKSLGD